MEKGHPLAASRAACISPSPAYVPAPAAPEFSPTAPQMPSSIPGMHSAAPNKLQMAWGDFGMMGGGSSEVRGLIPRGSVGLDGVGQALSAALQVSLLVKGLIQS